MNTVAYHLRARSPFHFGVRGVGVEATEVIAHADTLFAALCLGLRELAGTERLAEFLNAFPTTERPEQRPPLRLSSAFPLIQLGQGKLLRLYPKPALPPPELEKTQEDDPKRRKLFKKINFVSETIFLAWIEGNSLADHYDDEQKPCVLQEGQVWVEKEAWSDLIAKKRAEEIHFWKTERMTRVTLDRATHASQVYDAQRVHFSEGCGLWFAIRWLDETWRDVLEDVLHTLQDAGIGGERSAGHGQFKLHQSSMDKLPDNSGPLRMTLSVYHPTKKEVENGVLNGNEVSYQLLTRRGWLGSPEGGGLRHQAVRMLAEGSVFRANGNTIYGDLVDVTPPAFKAYPNWHPVYRYGLAFPIGVKL
jgi:CRISPR-associated protein Csm4